MKTATICLVGLSIIASAHFFPSILFNEKAIDYRTVAPDYRNLTSTVGATGTLEPCEIIDVGAQVNGRIVEFGIDPETGGSIDYGSHVKKGMVLARIDPSIYELEVQISAAQLKRIEAQIAQAKSQLDESSAALVRTKAELALQESKLQKAERDWERVSKLSKVKATSDSEVDASRTELEGVSASVAIGKAAVEQAKSRIETQLATVKAAEAERENALAVLQRAQTTLAYCSIVSPIDGTVIDRRVNQGQTVVASLATPSLFLLASDLRKLEIWVSVNEADIGLIRPGLPVRFTVDANPDESFSGQVKQVRLNASMSQNVVTYTVVVSVGNVDETLLPYLTANVEFILQERESVLSVPVAALRFEPLEDPTATWLKGDENREGHGTVWVEEEGGLREVAVRIGLSEGRFAEIEGGGLTEQSRIVVGIRNNDDEEAKSNPFTPRMPRRKK